MATDKSLLLVLRHSPYGSSVARSALDVALAMAAFDRAVTLLFMGDGVLQLCPEQDSEALGVKNVAKLLASLPLYGIEQVYVDAEAADRYQLDLESAPVQALPIDSREIAGLLDRHNQLMGF